MTRKELEQYFDELNIGDNDDISILDIDGARYEIVKIHKVKDLNNDAEYATIEVA